MTIVYTQELDKAIYMACCLGGISHQGKNIKIDRLDDCKADIIIESKKTGHILAHDTENEYVFIWGGNLVRICPPQAYGFTGMEKEGFFPAELKFQPSEGKENELDHICKILTNEGHSSIYVAAAGARGHSDFAMLYQYAGLAGSSKKISFLDISEMSPSGIQRAFANPLNNRMSQSALRRILTHQYIYTVANLNMPKVLPGFTSYPLMKEIPLLRQLVERSDLAEAENAKNKYTVSIEAYTKDDQHFTLESRKAVFATKAAQDEFISRILAIATISITETDKEEACPGLHNNASISDEAKRQFKYSPSKTRRILEELFDDGYISCVDSNYRLLPEDKIGEFRDLIALAARMKTFAPFIADAKEALIEPSRLSDGVSGILPTTKKPDKSLIESDEKRNIYLLLMKEAVKLVMGKYKTVKTTVSVNINDIDFTVSGTEVIDRGFTALEQKSEPRYPFPKELQDNETVRIKYSTHTAQSTALPMYAELDVRKAYTQDSAPVRFSIDEIDSVLSSLERKQLIIRRNRTILATPECRKFIHLAEEYENFTGAPIRWEQCLDQIRQELSEDDSLRLKNNLSIQVQDEIRDWIRRRDVIEGKEVNTPCPCCTSKLSRTKSNLHCPKCGYRIARVQFGRTMKDEEIYYLVKNRTTALLRDFIINGEYTYGRIYLDDTNQIKFTEDSTHKCPVCTEYLRVRDGLYYCSSCGYSIKPTLYGYTLRFKEFGQLLEKGHIKLEGKLKDAHGATFDAIVFIDKDNGNRVKCIKLKSQEDMQ